MTATLNEIAFLKLVQEKIPNSSQMHVRAMLCILGKKNSYLSFQEIERDSLIADSKLRKILKAFAKKKLVEKEGCLYKKPESEKLVEII